MVFTALGEFLLNNSVDLRKLDLPEDVVREVVQAAVHRMLEVEWIMRAVVDTNMNEIPERVTRFLDWLVPAGTMADNLLVQFCVAIAMKRKIRRRLVKIIFAHLQLSEHDYQFVLRNVRGSLPEAGETVLSTSPEKSGGANSTGSLQGSEPLVVPPSPIFVDVADDLYGSRNAPASQLSPDTVVLVDRTR